jgi:hypothetical protein
LQPAADSLGDWRKTGMPPRACASACLDLKGPPAVVILCT